MIGPSSPYIPSRPLSPWGFRNDFSAVSIETLLIVFFVVDAPCKDLLRLWLREVGHASRSIQWCDAPNGRDSVLIPKDPKLGVLEGYHSGMLYVGSRDLSLW